MSPTNLSSQSSRSSHTSRLSPRSPQLWMKPVNKVVDNQAKRVRFAASVRLSPSVDRLWTVSELVIAARHVRCANRAYECARSTNGHHSSTSLHRAGPTGSTTTPHLGCTPQRGQQVFVHTVPNTYDDDYTYRSPYSHITSELLTVDDSRTLALKFSGETSRRSTPHEGGHA